MGNRQLANSNTDEIFENRKVILSNIDCENEVEKNFVNAQINKTSLDYLNHRSQLNTSLLEVSEELADINSRLIEVNKKIMESNQTIVDFNSEQIAINRDLIDGSLEVSNSSPETNLEIIEKNTKYLTQTKIMKSLRFLQ